RCQWQNRGVDRLLDSLTAPRPRRRGMTRPAPLVAAVAFSVMSGPLPHERSQPPPATAERLGTTHFATSCARSVERRFDRAVALLHSFWFDAASREFKNVIDADAGCTIAYWGMALSYHGYRGQEAARRAGLEAIEQAKTAAPPKTQRERDYL